MQVAVLLGLIALVAWSMHTAWVRMHDQGIAYGFDVLGRATGWQISSPFLDQTPDDPYWWTILVALVDTLGASLMSILAACMLGVLVGVGLLAPNRVVAQIFRTYVEIFRNIPLVLQALFWYVTLTALPAPRANPPSFLNMAFVTNQGVFLPAIRLPSPAGIGWLWMGALALLLGSALWRWRQERTTRNRFSVLLMSGSLLATFGLGIFICHSGSIGMDVPRMTGFSFRGGWTIPLELIALVLATVLFSAAYIGEIVRGGLLSVPRGLIEAAQALGLPARVVFGRVRFPIALRSMVPALGNIFLFIVKATAIGSAIGYADIYSVSVVSISQTGQAIEFLVAMMAGYFLLNYTLTLLMNGLNRVIAFKGSR